MDEDPIGQLLDVAAGRLAAYGFLLTGSQSAGEGLVQDAIVGALARRRRPDNVTAVEAHVRAAMRTIHLDEVRRVTSWRVNLAWPRARIDAGDGGVDLASGGPLGSALAELPLQERAAVVLRHFDHLPIPDIAAAIRIAEVSVETLLSRAHATLSRTLGDIEPEFDQVLIVDRTRR